MHLLISLSELAAHPVNLFPRTLDIFGSLLDAFCDGVNGLLQLLHRAGLLHGALAQSLGGGGHLLRAAGDMLRAGDNLSHGGIEPLKDIVQGCTDGSKISHILLGNLCGQIAAGDCLQHTGDFSDIVPQAANGIIKTS